MGEGHPAACAYQRLAPPTWAQRHETTRDNGSSDRSSRDDAQFTCELATSRWHLQDRGISTTGQEELGRFHHVAYGPRPTPTRRGQRAEERRPAVRAHPVHVETRTRRLQQEAQHTDVSPRGRVVKECLARL